MKRVILAGMGRLAYMLGWPAFWVYFLLGHGRTRVIVQRGDEILMVKQWVGDGRWQLPGGGMHKGELPVAAAARELHEETGIVAPQDQLIPLGQSRQKSHATSFVIHVFKTQWHETTLRLQRIEIIEAAWMRPAQLNAHNTKQDVLAALQMLQ
ncbi:MAG TPA: NUDIX hydrolase [Candidatus Saccharimonadales bacterium]|nr:NUDIX hydrolase [Candidatus Saccharimonadales bacterium]